MAQFRSSAIISGGFTSVSTRLKMPNEAVRNQSRLPPFSGPPLLKQNAIKAQSSYIDFASGASTSFGFQEAAAVPP